MNKKAAMATLLILTVVSTLALSTYATYPTPPRLTPRGRIRVSLLPVGLGVAKWFPGELYDGSFSAKLGTGDAPGDDGGLVMIGPLSWPLSYFVESQITFWAYHLTSTTLKAYVNLVLDNDRVIGGTTSVPVSGTVTCESGSGCLGYTGSEIWIKMKPADGASWYTNVPADPVIVAAGVSGCILSAPCTLSTWKAAFPTARVIQVQIDYGFWPGNPDNFIYIDNVSLLGMTVLVEPEVIAATP
jgi:hypothetical protein